MTDVLGSVMAAITTVKSDTGGNLTAETRIDDLRLDSLDEVEILMALEDQHQVEIDQAQVKSCATLGDLARLIERQAKPGAEA
jgi:acyl carrier protein